MDYKTLLLSAKGRITRKTYWLSALALVAAMLLLSGIAFAAAGVTTHDGIISFSTGTAGTIVVLLVSLAFIPLYYVALMLAIKRCHDRDRSGWFIFAGLIPFVGAIWYLVETAFLRGTVGPNRFGPDPLGSPLLAYAAAA